MTAKLLYVLESSSTYKHSHLYDVQIMSATNDTNNANNE